MNDNYEISMKLVSREKQGGGKYTEYAFSNLMDSFWDITEKQASDLINSTNGQSKWLDKEMSGKTYLQIRLGWGKPYGEVTVELLIKKATTIGSILWQYACAYKKIYEEKLYDSWGDIWFVSIERMRIYENGVIEFSLGT